MPYACAEIRHRRQSGRAQASLYGGDNGVEVFCQEASAADQSAIDVFNVQDLTRILRLHRAAIENTRRGTFVAETIAEDGADAVMHLSNFFIGWRAPRPNGPDGLIGHDNFVVLR